MRVLLFSRYCKLGGAETFMLSLRAGLLALGHECELFFLERGPLEQYIPSDSIVHFGDLAHCIRVASARRYDVIHARSWDWEAGVWVMRRLAGKLVVTSHGSVGPGWNSTNCDAFVTCARWLAERQQPWTDLPVQVVLNGIDTMRFTPASAGATARPIVGWVGRGSDPRKRLDAFAEVAVRLHRCGKRIWLIEPHGPDEVAAVLPQAVAMLRPVVDFWGRVPIQEMPGRYRDIAASGGCVVSTARWEGLPLTLLEAQACGVPVVASDVPGTNECVLPQHGGVLFPLDLPAADLAEVIDRTLGDSAAMTERRRAVAKFVHEHFTLQRMAHEYARIYEEAPYPSHLSFLDGIRRRRLLSPIWNWEAYIDHGREVGVRQFEAAKQLLSAGETRLARIAARAALSSSPTIYLRPSRMTLLAKAHRWDRFERRGTA